MIRVVLDANVLVSGLISRKGTPGKILDTWIAGDIRLCVSPAILQELVRVLKYPRISERLGQDQAALLLNKLETTAELVSGKLELQVLTRDPSDNVYLACAVEGHCDYLVTGNMDHFNEAGEIYKNVKIVSPRTFLDLLSAVNL